MYKYKTVFEINQLRLKIKSAFHYRTLLPKMSKYTFIDILMFLLVLQHQLLRNLADGTLCVDKEKNLITLLLIDQFK